MSYSSIFNSRYDVAIYGAGYAGLAAAWSLAKSGAKVLLFDRRLDVAWESGRSFAAAAGTCESDLWRDFVEELQSRGLYKNGIIDSAGAELVVAARLRAGREQLRTLLNAWPVQAQLQGEAVHSVTVATKSGTRTVQADRWIDASDEATLFRIVAPQQSLRAPAYWEQRALLFHEAIAGVTPSPISDALTLERRVWNNEYALCARGKAPQSRSDLLTIIDGARAAFPAPLSQAAIAGLAVEPIPIYSDNNESADKSTFASIGNVTSASPALCADAVDSLGARFALGIEAAARLGQLAGVGDIDAANLETRQLPQRSEKCDVFIAGVGTAGALAAIAARGEGVKVLSSDAASFAGGVASGGLINGYFHGQSGGLFEQFDAQAQQVGSVINPQKPARGHETKKIAFEQNVPDGFLAETLTYQVTTENSRVQSLLLASPREIIEVEAQAVVDATGDGDVAVLAGAEYDFGRAVDGFPLSYSQPSLRVNGPRLQGTNFDAGWADPTDPEDLTRARLTAIAQYLRDDFSDEDHLVLFAPILGLRQSRQIKTEERLTLGDMITHQEHANSVGIIRSPLDTHSIDYEFEDDEALFWLWGCKSFRESTFADMPYGMMVPRGLQNVWMACRAAGMTPPAAYAARMQRDLQRLGEAAGYAAALSVKENQSNAVDINVLQQKLRATGALVEMEESETVDALAALESGIPGPYMWQIYSDRATFESAISDKLQAANPHVSWLAAVILAMWNDGRAEARLIAAIENQEIGVDTPPLARGPFSQLIDVPNWFLAISLLRLCGSEKCLPALQPVAAQPGNILNLRTAIALTVARLGTGLNDAAKASAADIIKVLLQDAVPDTVVRPSRSIFRGLRGEAQQQLPQEPQWVDTREDHRWRLDFAITKAARALEIENPVDVNIWQKDERALVRNAFAELV